MPGSDPQTGDVYYYPYVWKRQQNGTGEAEKHRPCCVVLRPKNGAFRGANTFMLALTQSGVPEGGHGEVVPPDIMRGLRKLDATSVTHLVTSEFNSDLADHPNFEDLDYLGRLPPEFLKPIMAKLIDHLRAGSGELNRTGT